MKKFKFNLEAVKKLREFKEQVAKVELGKIGQQIQATKVRLAACDEHLDQSYRSQRELLIQGGESRAFSFFPLFNQGKRSEIKMLEEQLQELQSQYQRQLTVVNEMRGEAKLINNLRDKKKQEYIKEEQKKMNLELEDLNIITGKNRLKGGNS